MGSWQIVKFTEENDMVEAIPSSWIFEESGRFKCLWPETISSTKVAAAIRAQEEPKDNWKSVPVEIMSCVPYENFQTATKKATIAEYTSELETESEYSKGEMTKRTKKKNPRYMSSEDESPPGKVVRRSPRFKLPTPPRNSSNLTTSQYETVLNVKRNLNLQREGIAESPRRITPFMEESTLQLDTNVSVVKKNVNLAQEIMTKSDSFIPPPNTCSSSQEYTEVIRLLHIINGRVKQNAELITTLLNHQCDNIQRIEPEGEEINIPAKSYQELMELDQKLFDEKTRNFIVGKLLHIGGSDLKEVIRRSMPQLVDDIVLKEFSWVGGKGKKKFSMLTLSNLIKEVCKRNPLTKHNTEKAVEERLAIFLTKAAERCNRKMNKENRQSDAL